MNLLDRYVVEIGKYLPQRTRADIQAEIRSTLQDMLEERSSGQPASDEEISAVLKEYGAPREVAASYGGVQYLIGPLLFPTFELVLRIAFSVLGVLTLVGLAFSAVSSGVGTPGMSAALVRAGSALISGLVTSFGIIVLIFAILERTLKASDLEERKREWDPADLAREPGPDQVKYADRIASIVFTIIFLIVLNHYAQTTGFGFMEHGVWTYISVLSRAFFQYVPWINLIGLFSIAIDVWLLRAGAWDVRSRCAQLVLVLGRVALALVMLAGPSIIAIFLVPDSLPQLDRLAPLLSQLSMLILLAVILGEGIDAVKIARRLFVSWRSAPFELPAGLSKK